MWDFKKCSCLILILILINKHIKIYVGMWFPGFYLPKVFSVTVLDCASSLPTENEDRGRLLRKITCPKSQKSGDLLIPSPWSQISKTLWQCFTGPYKTRRKAVQPRQHQESPTADGKLLVQVSSLSADGSFITRWLCATLPGQTGDGTRDASVTHVLANSRLGMPAGITSLLFTHSITHRALGKSYAPLSGTSNQYLSFKNKVLLYQKMFWVLE